MRISPMRRGAALAVLLAVLGSAHAIEAQAGTLSSVKAQLQALHLRPAPLVMPTLPKELSGTDVTLEREPWLTIAFEHSTPFIDVFERIGKPALLNQLIHDPRQPRISKARLRRRTVYRIVGDITYGYAWHEQNRTYMLFSHDADGITFAQLARMVDSLQPLQ